MAYEYDHDCPFEAFITNLGKYNEGELVGEWVKFPTTSEELQKVFERIGIGLKDDFGNPYEEWFISDYDCYVDEMYEKLGEYENLDELNYLASKLDELDDHDYNHFQAAMQISDYTGSIIDVINLIDNLDKYEIYPGVESNADLGHYYIEELGMVEVPDYPADYINYEAYGRDVVINEMGQFTDYGYVRDTQESFTEYYDGDRENIPDEYRVMDFMVSTEKERKTMNYETFKQEFAEDIKEKLYAEEKMAANKVIKTHIFNYAKTRQAYIAYRKSGYSKKFFEAHRDEITLHKAAKEAFSKLPDGKIPKVKNLNEEFAKLFSEKKAAYSEYKKIKKEMRAYQIAKQNQHHKHRCRERHLNARGLRFRQSITRVNSH